LHALVVEKDGVEGHVGIRTEDMYHNKSKVDAPHPLFTRILTVKGIRAFALDLVAAVEAGVNAEDVCKHGLHLQPLVWEAVEVEVLGVLLPEPIRTDSAHALILVNARERGYCQSAH
jgi:hypothetical protein